MNREQKAAEYIRQSGKTIHSSDCATSVAPAEEPGPCDCKLEMNNDSKLQVTSRKGSEMTARQMDAAQFYVKWSPEHFDMTKLKLLGITSFDCELNVSQAIEFAEAYAASLQAELEAARQREADDNLAFTHANEVIVKLEADLTAAQLQLASAGVSQD